jgi:hypothetical protein
MRVGAAAVGAASAGITFALIFSTVSIAPRAAQALPSYARQTGQTCGRCHTDFPGLTPFGRRFKLGGYTLGGGDFQTTPFPAAGESGKGEGKGWVPPVSMMGIIGFTHTQAPQDPTGSPYKPNDNVVVSPVSLFYGGAITDNIGAFVQATYNAPGMGAPPDPFVHRWSWDNTDIRYANTTKIGDLDVLYGITANNNPTVQDVWNSTPAWTFPYAVSNLAPMPAAKTIIDGVFAAHVGSVGGYLFINDMFYLEATAYRTLDFGAQNSLGIDPFGAPGLINGMAPYFRVAFEPHKDNHYLQIGAFSMIANVRPWVDTSGMSGSATFAQADKYTDVGVDSQYQYQGENFWFTLRGSYIHESQNLNASFANGLADNITNKLNTARAQASLAYGNESRIVLTGQYFSTWGTPDATLYSGLASGFSPNSNGYIAEIAYIPFGMTKSPLWPWFNARLGLQYIYYNKFDGTTFRAKDNNTLFLYLWVAG